MHMNRRSLITGLISLVASPAIVRATSLMPVRAVVETQQLYEIFYICTAAGVTFDSREITHQSNWKQVTRLDAREFPNMPRWSPNTAYSIGDLVRG